MSLQKKGNILPRDFRGTVRCCHVDLSVLCSQVTLAGTSSPPAQVGCVKERKKNLLHRFHKSGKQRTKSDYILNVISREIGSKYHWDILVRVTVFWHRFSLLGIKLTSQHMMQNRWGVCVREGWGGQFQLIYTAKEG